MRHFLIQMITFSKLACWLGVISIAVCLTRPAWCRTVMRAWILAIRKALFETGFRRRAHVAVMARFDFSAMWPIAQGQRLPIRSTPGRLLMPAISRERQLSLYEIQHSRGWIGRFLP